MRLDILKEYRYSLNRRGRIELADCKLANLSANHVGANKVKEEPSALLISTFSRGHGFKLGSGEFGVVDLTTRSPFRLRRLPGKEFEDALSKNVTLRLATPSSCPPCDPQVIDTLGGK